MQIACPNCATSYAVEPSKLGSAGRSVRCVRCRKVWFAANGAALAAIAQSHRAEVIEFAAATPIAGLMADTDAQPEQHVFEPMPHIAAGESQPGSQPLESADDSVEISEIKADWGVAVDPLLAAEARRLAGKDAPEESPPEESSPELSADAPPLDESIPQAEELIVIDEAPALVPVQEEAMALRPAYMEHVEVPLARAAPQHATRSASRWRRPKLSTVILALLAINTALIAFRAELVRWAPQTAALYSAIGLPVNLRGLSFADVTTEHATHEGVPVLVVEGTITSASGRAVEVPRLRFALRNQSGAEIYSWTAVPTRSVLGPGESVTFRSRLASPPAEGHSLMVRFLSRRDQIAGNL